MTRAGRDMSSRAVLPVHTRLTLFSFFESAGEDDQDRISPSEFVQETQLSPRIEQACLTPL